MLYLVHMSSVSIKILKQDGNTDEVKQDNLLIIKVNK